MAKKPKSKSTRRRPGRPRSRGETVNVSFRLSKKLHDRIEAARKALDKSRTEVIEAFLEKGIDLRSRGD